MGLSKLTRSLHGQDHGPTINEEAIALIGGFDASGTAF
jgi:hypothetical protein